MMVYNIIFTDRINFCIHASNFCDFYFQSSCDLLFAFKSLSRPAPGLDLLFAQYFGFCFFNKTDNDHLQKPEKLTLKQPFRSTAGGKLQNWRQL